jgi:hypothetical protein
VSGTRDRAELEIKDKVCIERRKVESGKCSNAREIGGRQSSRSS